MLANIDLTVVWALIIAFAVFAYIVMDGFDLGIGILFPAFRPGHERDTAMNSIAPVWDGNETWLVLGGGGLFAVFPLAYAVIMPALYAPIIAMLLGLIFRGVAFEFRWRDPRHRALWDVAFTGGSVVAACAQGITLGALLQGIKVEGRAYAGSWWDWLTPFSLLVGLGIVCGYALLGATWLVMRTEGSLQDRARTFSLWLGATTVAVIAAVSAATPFLEGKYGSAGSRCRACSSPHRCHSSSQSRRSCSSAGCAAGRRERRSCRRSACSCCPSSGSGSASSPTSCWAVSPSGRRRHRMRARSSCSSARRS